MIQTQNSAKQESRKHHGLTYIIFLMLGVINLINNDLTVAIIFLALAMGFIPFDLSIFSNGMTHYQKALVIVHVLVVIGMIILLISGI